VRRAQNFLNKEITVENVDKTMRDSDKEEVKKEGSDD